MPRPLGSGRPKGLKKSGGRARGVHNVDTLYVRGVAARRGIEVADLLVSWALDEKISIERREKAALALLPHILPRLGVLEARVNQRI
jgi:hypothetical protein